jgi:hypothetical protein
VKKVVRRISDLYRQLTVGHRNYIMRFVIEAVHNVNVTGSMKIK